MKKFSEDIDDGKVLLIVVFVVLVGFIIHGISNYDYYSSRKSRTKSISWKQHFKVNEVDNVLISLDTILYESAGMNVRYWKKTKNVYQNNKIVSPESLYKWKDFLYKQCDEYYVLLTKLDIDSIVYDFAHNFYKEYNAEEKLINSTDFFNSKKSIQKKYIRALPKCEE